MSSVRSKSHDPNKETVLIVDDNHANLLILENFMAHYGCNVLLAKDGRKALQLFSRNDVHLVLMDVMMPGMDGFEATQNIRKFEDEMERAQTPIIAVTAHIQPSEQHRCIQAGMNDYIPKPVKAQKLIDTIKLWCPEMSFTAPNQAFARAIA